MKKRRRRQQVLALHAIGATYAMWDDVGSAAPELDLLTPDLLGLAVAVGGRLGSLVRALAGMVPRDPLILTGCSVGGNIALELAALLGERVQGVLLLDPQPIRPHPAFRKGMREYGRLLRAEMDADEAAAWAPLVFHTDGARWHEAAPRVREMLRVAGGAASEPLVRISADFPDGSPLLGKIRAPVRALFAAENVMPFLQAGWRSGWEKALRPDAMELVEGARHWLPLEAPGRVAAGLLEFMSTVRGTAPAD